MTTRRDFLKTAAATPLAGLATPGIGTLSLNCQVTECGTSETLYAGKPMSYWIARLNQSGCEPEYEDMGYHEGGYHPAMPVPSVPVSFGQSAVRPLIEALNTEDSYYAGDQLKSLATPRTIRLLAEALKHEQPLIRIGAILTMDCIAIYRRVYPQVTEPLREVLPAITEALRDENATVTKYVYSFLHGHGPYLDPNMTFPCHELESEDASRRRATVRLLGRHRSNAEEVVPLLEVRLRDTDASVRWEAAGVLSEFDPDHAGILPVFIDYVLHREDFFAPRFHGLDRIVPKALPILRKALDSAEPRTRQSIAEVLEYSKSEVVLPLLFEMQKDASPEVRCKAVRSLMWFDAPECVPHLMRALGDEDQKVRAEARWVLRFEPLLAAEALPDMLSLLNSGEPCERVSMSLIVDAMGTKALPALRKNLEHAECRVRLAAALAIDRLELAKADGSRVTLWSRDYSCPHLTEKDIEALARLGPDLKTIVPKLANGLRAVSSRPSSAELLRLLGHRAAPALPQLVALLKDKALGGNGLRYDVYRCLTNIGTEATSPLVRLLTEDDEFIRTRALRALDLLGPRAKSVVPTLVKFAKTGTPPEQVLAIEALENIGPGVSAMPTLRALLHDDDLGVRRAAVVTLGAMNQQAEPAIPDLAGMLNEPGLSLHIKWSVAKTLVNTGASSIPTFIQASGQEDAAVRCCAARGLGEFEGHSHEVIPSLVKLLSDVDVQVRNEATRSLAKMGPKARVATSRLKGLLDDPCDVVRENAETAIAAIQAPEKEPADAAG